MRLQPLYVSLVAAALVPAHPSNDKPPNAHRITMSTFRQLTDHHNPSFGKFDQRYFFSDEFYTGHGAPIIILTPGEKSAENSGSMLTNPNNLMRAIMQSLGAAGVVIEREYLSFLPLPLLAD